MFAATCQLNNPGFALNVVGNDEVYIAASIKSTRVIGTILARANVPVCSVGELQYQDISRRYMLDIEIGFSSQLEGKHGAPALPQT